MATINEWLESKGFQGAKGAPLNGEFFRFDRGGSLNGYFKCRLVKLGAMEYPVALVGDWRTGEVYYYRASSTSPKEEGALSAELARLEAEEEEALRARQKEAATYAEEKWDEAITRGLTPYSKKKGLTQLYGARICPEYTDTLLVPMRDISGKLWGLQRILPEKLDTGLDKLFPKNGRIKGCFHLISETTEIDHEGEIYVCEGYSTGASIYEAVRKPVACAFNAGNLEAVCRDLRAEYPSAKLVVAGDDDRWVQRPNGRPWNPGREKATAAAQASSGVAVFPIFDEHELEKRLTDFNDLARCTDGLARVRRCLESPPKGDDLGAGAGGPNDEFSFEGITALPAIISKSGIPLPPRQQKIAEHILQFLNRRVIKQERDLFYYVGTHWKILTTADHDRLKMTVQRVCQGNADVKHVDATYKLLLYHIPTPPSAVDMFTPHPFCVNFLNGTLHLLKDGQKYRTEFKPHRPEDYLVHVLPYEYRAGDPTQNTEFLTMLERVFEGDTDKAEKIQAVRQMYGACLLPAFPHLFMLWGKPGTGKSTVLNIAARLVHKDNLCSVPPSQWHGFNMEGMACKLVNIDTDIPLREPIDDDVAKKVLERRPFRIRRKGIKDLMAPIPAVHLFGGNDIPATLDGASRAHNRRWTFLEFNAFVTPTGDYDKYYWDHCFEVSPQGVLNFALEGLTELLANGGHFLNPASGKEKMESWQLATDPVGQFLVDLQEGEVDDQSRMFILAPEEKIERNRLWEAFQEWHERALNSAPKLGRTKFYDLLRAKNVTEIKIGGVRYFKGVSEREAPTKRY